MGMEISLSNLKISDKVKKITIKLVKIELIKTENFASLFSKRADQIDIMSDSQELMTSLRAFQIPPGYEMINYPVMQNSFVIGWKRINKQITSKYIFALCLIEYATRIFAKVCV
jgi:hypothetical protein